MPPSFFDLPRAIQIESLDLLADWFVARHAERIEELRMEEGSGDQPSRIR